MALLKKGDPAPSFEGRDQNGEIVDSKKLRGKKIILYFYPKDMTPGCTDEACSLRDSHKEISGKGFVVIGVSADDEESHRKFIDKHQLPFTLIADTDHQIIKSFGAWGEKKLYGRVYEGILRSTFVINEKGIIEEVIEKVRTKEHAAQILSTIKT